MSRKKYTEEQIIAVLNERRGRLPARKLEFLQICSAGYCVDHKDLAVHP